MENEAIEEETIIVLEDEEQCAVCLMPLFDGQVLEPLKCWPTHVFHSACTTRLEVLYTVKEKKENYSRCPVCRAEFISSTAYPAADLAAAGMLIHISHYPPLRFNDFKSKFCDSFENDLKWQIIFQRYLNCKLHLKFSVNEIS